MINSKHIDDSDFNIYTAKLQIEARPRIDAGPRIQAGGGWVRRRHRCASMSAVLNSIKTFIYFRYDTRIGFRFQLQ